MLLCNSTAETNATCAERIREAIAAGPIRVRELELTVTVSIGNALSSPRDSMPGEQLIAIANSALYRAKNHGRNRVEVGLANNLIQFLKREGFNSTCAF
jgi:diguanylate cyclase (GGDEF)-like protein